MARSARFGPSPATPAGGWESATVKIEPSGKVTVMTGASPHGQGEETTFAQIAADELGVDIDDVLVLHGDTAIVQYGIGTFGSRGYGHRRDGAVLRAAGSEREDQEVRRDAARIGRRHFREWPGDVQQDRQNQDVRGNRRGNLSRHETAAEYRAGTAMPRTSGSRPTSRSASARTSSSRKSTGKPGRSKFVATSLWTIAATF